MAQPLPSQRGVEGFNVDPSQGLSSEEAASRLTRYGPNLLTPEQRRASWTRFLQPFRDPMVLILMAAGAVFIALGDVSDGVIMLAAVVPVIVVDAVLEIRAEQALERLRSLTAPRTIVRRDRQEMNIPSEEIVPGDVILLKEGDLVPADGTVQSESVFQVDESALTGESLPVTKATASHPAAAEPESRVFAGTIVLSGRATVIVTITGSQTEYGRIGTLVAGTDIQLTPIQRTIGTLVRNLGIVAVAASLGVAGLELARGAGLTEALLAGISLAIAAIPEEFSIVYAIYLTMGAWQMARRNTLVRRLAGVETLGSTTVICTDKTGTLTQGRLEVQGLFAEGKLQLGQCDTKVASYSRLLEDALLASEPQPFDPLDQSIANLAVRGGIDPSKLYAQWTMEQDYPFDPERKHVTHVWKAADGGIRASSKGSLEGLLDLSMPMAQERDALLRANREMADQGMRVIAVAEKGLRRSTGERWADEAGMKVVGLIGFADPLREGVREAIAECQSAGIRVMMITGDHPLTAHAIAEATGIRHNDGELLTGPEVERLDDSALAGALERTAIFARVLPAQKYRIVQGLKARGQVVAMTGDGINDAPALRAADIGVAMGQRGTEVAREAATMVLLDDNFGTIVEAVRQGRHIFNSLQRAFLYLITFHIPIVLTAIVIPLIGAPLLLLPIHLVWLEMIIHPTAALVFESDPPPADLMRRGPRNPRDPIVSLPMALLVTGRGAAILLGVVGIYIASLAAGSDINQSRAAGIAVLVIAQTILVLQTRSPEQPIWHRSLLDNAMLLPALIGTLASLGLMIYLPILSAAAQLAPPTTVQWLQALVVAAISTLPFELRKLR